MYSSLCAALLSSYKSSICSLCRIRIRGLYAQKSADACEMWESNTFDEVMLMVRGLESQSLVKSPESVCWRASLFLRRSLLQSEAQTNWKLKVEVWNKMAPPPGLFILHFSRFQHRMSQHREERTQSFDDRFESHLAIKTKKCVFKLTFLVCELQSILKQIHVWRLLLACPTFQLTELNWLVRKQIQGPAFLQNPHPGITPQR